MPQFAKGSKKKAIVHRESLKHHFQDYCASTSIHGIKYVGDTSRPILERVWWIAIMCICLVGNFYLIHKVWIKWTHSPVIVSFSETATPIWEVPFPAVTLCSEIKSNADVFNFTDFMLRKNNESVEIDDDDNKKLGYISMLCDDHVLIDTDLYTDNSSLEFLIAAVPEVDETTLVCQFAQDSLTNCSSYFYRIFTDEGVCFSFNMLSPSELFRGYGNPEFIEHSQQSVWSLEEGYSKMSELTAYPRRVISAGATTSLNVVVKFRLKDADYHCRGPVRGFKVLLHDPGEFPLVRERYLRVPLSSELIAVVQPNIMQTSFGLRPYSPKVRQCFFPSERYLAHFQIYTQRNCEVECLTNFTLANCGCVALWMPRNETTILCGAGSKSCMTEAEMGLKLVEIEAARNDDINSKCNCLPSCQSINYDSTTSQAEFNSLKTVLSYGDNGSELAGFEASRIKIYFKDMQFTTSRRSELFGPVDFLANVGGLLGLFCGISILSLCEIVYYVTLRLWANIRLIKKKHESIDREDPTAFSGSPPPSAGFDPKTQ